MLRSKMTFITTPSCTCSAQVGTTLDTLITIATISLRLLGSWNSVGCLQAVICGEFTLGTAVKTWEEDTYEEGEIWSLKSSASRLAMLFDDSIRPAYTGI